MIFLSSAKKGQTIVKSEDDFCMNPAKFKIAIDVRGSQNGFREHFHRGIGRFVLALAPKLPPLIPDAEFFWIFDSRYERGSLPILPGVTEVFTPPLRGLNGLPAMIRNQLVMPSFISKLGPDLVLFFKEDDAVSTRAKSAVFIYDTIPQLLPSICKLGRNPKELIRDSLVKRLARSANQILTISENSKKDINKIMGIEFEKIAVVDAAIDHNVIFRRTEVDISNVREKYHLPLKYFIYVGGIDPRKNVPKMLEAFRLLSSEINDVTLVIAGRLNNQKEYPALKETINTFHIYDKVILPGYIPDEELAAVYSGARAMIFPSLYEGFGLPIIEALACGIPVVAGKLSSIPEIARDLPIYCDVRDGHALSQAMKLVYYDCALQSRLKAEGPSQARVYNWDTVAGKVAERLIHILKS